MGQIITSFWNAWTTAKRGHDTHAALTGTAISLHHTSTVKLFTQLCELISSKIAWYSRHLLNLEVDQCRLAGPMFTNSHPTQIQPRSQAASEGNLGEVWERGYSTHAIRIHPKHVLDH